MSAYGGWFDDLIPEDRRPSPRGEPRPRSNKPIPELVSIVHDNLKIADDRLVLAACALFELSKRIEEEGKDFDSWAQSNLNISDTRRRILLRAGGSHEPLAIIRQERLKDKIRQGRSREKQKDGARGKLSRWAKLHDPIADVQSVLWDVYARFSKVPKADSLVPFLAKLGGIRDEGGLLKARDFHNRRMVGGARLGRTTGMSMDDALRRAVDAGYLDDPGDASGGTSELTHDDLLDAIEADNNRDRVWPRSDRDRMQSKEAELQNELFGEFYPIEAKWGPEVRSYVCTYSDSQTPPPDSDIVRALEIYDAAKDNGGTLQDAFAEAFREHRREEEGLKYAAEHFDEIFADLINRPS